MADDNTLSDVGSGAASGAAVGSVVPGIGTLVGGAVGAAGGLIGHLFSGGDQQKAIDAAQAAAAIIAQTGAPPDQYNNIYLQQFKQAGVYTPALEQAMNQDPSLVNKIQEDPSLKTAQMGALQSLSQRGQTGFTAADIAALNQARTQANSDVSGQVGAIRQNMAARGMAGGGNELAMSLNAAQAGGNRESQAGLQQAGTASQNALQAMTQAGALGGQIRGQDFSVAQQKAAAQDAVNQFNAQNAMQRQARNVQQQNQGQLYNVGQQQAAANANTQQANQLQYAQAQAANQQWQQQLGLNQAKAAALQGQAGTYQGMANATNQGFQTAGGAVGAGINAYGNASDTSNFLNRIYGKNTPQVPGQTSQTNTNPSTTATPDPNDPTWGLQ